MYAVGVAIHVVLWIFIALLWVRFVFDWVQAFARSWTPKGPLLVLLEVVYTTTDPPILALRRVLPPVRLGGVALDLSLLLVLLGAYLLLVLNRGLLIEG